MIDARILKGYGVQFPGGGRANELPLAAKVVVVDPDGRYPDDLRPAGHLCLRIGNRAVYLHTILRTDHCLP